ncbi:MAG: hypothetical protein ER33_14725 [Cyanobium sp. CACIAM 14]|nr:MAG: hypothetical protein ER33_14725 [Cyanobium sp. CACIAM 14]
MADVPAACEQAIGAGSITMAAPKPMPWGQTVACVRSIDRANIGLGCHRAGAARPTMDTPAEHFVVGLLHCSQMTAFRSLDAHLNVAAASSVTAPLASPADHSPRPEPIPR